MTMMAGLSKGVFILTRKHYSLDFKREVIRQVLQTQSPSSIARKHQINSFIIYRWVKEYKEGKYNSL
ncbi:transposase [Aneurinibacillus sp. Ricciae_BoGa-3]|uniref:transposase n=1 Tax=Aneurinibacillus sp. Ricciae_BoGa-3 TaxID=3022697 RepID=UPI003FA453BA